MLIDLTCPAEVFSTALPTEEIPAVSLALYNLSDRVIVSVEVTLKLLSGSGAEKERVVYRARALNGRPHSTFQMNVPCNPVSGARSADVTIDKVWFNDNAVWRRENSSSVEYTSNALPVSKALTNLQFVAGETAVGFPSQQDGLWVCVCGRPNPDSEEYCARCRREKSLLFTRYNREAVEKQIAQREKQLELSTRSVREDTARMQRIREEEYEQKQRRKTRRWRLAIFIPVCAFIAAFHLGFSHPMLQLFAADKAISEKHWENAEHSLKILGSFPGAERKLKDVRRAMAMEKADNAQTTEQMKAAAEGLRALEEDPEAAARAEELDLKRAENAMETGDTEAAREAVEIFPEEDPRRIAIENECLYIEAKAQMAAGDYELAREAFLLLYGNPAFPDTGTLAAECVYLPAMELLEQGKYDDAIQEMSRIPDYAPSRTAILECHYRKAQEAESLGDLETASAEYLMAGPYEDAEAKTQETVFLLAEEKFAAGETAAARSLYASIPGYPPAMEKEKETTLIIAKEAMDNQEYELAAELLDTLPEGYGDADELIPRAAYLAGSDASRRKDWEKAVSFLEQAGDYRDAPSMLEKALESLCKARLDDGDGAGALEIIPRITHSKYYKEYKMEAEYLDAMAQITLGGDPAELQKRFEALGSYRDAADRAKQMIYTRAMNAEALDEILTAAKLYEEAGNYRDAKARSRDLYDSYYGGLAEKVKEAMDSGDYPLAVTLLETIDREALPEQYKGLRDDYETACISAGEKLYQAGRPYEAAQYFRLVKDERKTKKWLNGACYRIIGQWKNKEGEIQAEFREDSTCEIAGEAFVFLVSDSYTLKTEKEGEMETSFRISNLTDERLTLRDMREGHTEVYELTRVGAETETEGEPEEEPEAEKESFEVQE